MKSKYTKEDLEIFRNIILTKLSKAEEEYQSLKKAINESSSVYADSGSIKIDDSTEVEEKETLSELATRQGRFIQNLNNALRRIDNGTYGICVVTGKLINKERLKLVPHTTHSIEAKNMRY